MKNSLLALWFSLFLPLAASALPITRDSAHRYFRGGVEYGGKL